MRSRRVPKANREREAVAGNQLAISRRAAISGIAIGPLITGLPPGNAAGDHNLAICQQWIAMDVEHRQLLAEWGTLEGWLIKNRRWFRLSPDERAAVPEGARFSQIEARLDMLEVDSNALLKAMRPTPAKSVEAIIANLSVAARLIFAEDHPEAHGLITRAVRDLAAFSSGGK
uniref:Uncharacterized protein n=1 Tax=Caulobacter sp. (strain K31) TaxID=366602 RepID=B0SXV1_CAUSK